MTINVRGMAAKVLRRHGFWKIKDREEPIFLKHTENLGTIVAVVKGDKAVISIPKLRVLRILKASQLERLLDSLWL